MAPTQRLKKLLEQAANGCAESQFQVGERFREGKEGAIINDFQKGQMAKCYLQAAHQGHVKAQAAMGAILLTTPGLAFCSRAAHTCSGYSPGRPAGMKGIGLEDA